MSQILNHGCVLRTAHPPPNLQNLCHTHEGGSTYMSILTQYTQEPRTHLEQAQEVQRHWTHQCRNGNLWYQKYALFICLQWNCTSMSSSSFIFYFFCALMHSPNFQVNALQAHELQNHQFLLQPVTYYKCEYILLRGLIFTCNDVASSRTKENKYQAKNDA